LSAAVASAQDRGRTGNVTFTGIVAGSRYRACGPFEREGYYVHFAYALTPRWEVIGRYDTWDPDTHLATSSANASERDYIGGFNYLVGDHMKLQFNLVRKTFTDAVVGPANVDATRLQIAW
jgi:hypothetical protein